MLNVMLWAGIPMTNIHTILETNSESVEYSGPFFVNNSEFYSECIIMNNCAFDVTTVDYNNVERIVTKDSSYGYRSQRGLIIKLYYREGRRAIEQNFVPGLVKTNYTNYGPPRYKLITISEEDLCKPHPCFIPELNLIACQYDGQTAEERNIKHPLSLDAKNNSCGFVETTRIAECVSNLYLGSPMEFYGSVRFTGAKYIYTILNDKIYKIDIKRSTTYEMDQGVYDSGVKENLALDEYRNYIIMKTFPYGGHEREETYAITKEDLNNDTGVVEAERVIHGTGKLIKKNSKEQFYLSFSETAIKRKLTELLENKFGENAEIQKWRALAEQGGDEGCLERIKELTEQNDKLSRKIEDNKSDNKKQLLQMTEKQHALEEKLRKVNRELKQAEEKYEKQKSVNEEVLKYEEQTYRKKKLDIETMQDNLKSEHDKEMAALKLRKEQYTVSGSAWATMGKALAIAVPILGTVAGIVTGGFTNLLSIFTSGGSSLTSLGGSLFKSVGSLIGKGVSAIRNCFFGPSLIWS